MVESDTCYDTIEDMIAGQEPPFRVLRLLCLQSLTGGGIKSSRLDSFKREVVQTYGYVAGELSLEHSATDVYPSGLLAFPLEHSATDVYPSGLLASKQY